MALYNCILAEKFTNTPDGVIVQKPLTELCVPAFPSLCTYSVHMTVDKRDVESEMLKVLVHDKDIVISEINMPVDNRKNVNAVNIVIENINDCLKEECVRTYSVYSNEKLIGDFKFKIVCYKG